MKKIITLGVMLMMVLALFTSCSQNNNGKVIVDGSFYSLQSAYNHGLLTKKDLKEITKLKNNGNIEKIDEQIGNRIKQSYSNCYSQEKVEEVIIDRYLGTYNGSVAIMIGYKNNEYTSVCWEEKIADVTFKYSDGQRIYIWKE